MGSIKTRWQSSSVAAQAGFVFFLALIVAFFVAGAFFILRDDYQILFSDLNGRDAAAMIGELDRMKVPYRLADDGAAILVERDAVYKTRLKLMEKGLDLHGVVGLEVFDNADFGMTEFAQKVNYQRALQGELTRTITGFDEVKLARVHLVLPEVGLFKRQNAKPKASISLLMKGDQILGLEQITGIQRLVAASVPEVEASDVTIVDHRGMAISKAVSSDEASAVVSTRLQAKTQIEDHLTRKIVGVLDRAIGPGKAIVSVDATIDYDQVKVTKDDVVPIANKSGHAVGAIVRKRETQQGGDLFDEVSGIGSGNLGQTGGIRNTGTSSADIEFVNGRRVEQLVSAPGSIKRLSVGVLVPDVSDPAVLAKLREVVIMASGVNVGRGDLIVVYSIDSPRNSVIQESEEGVSANVALPLDAPHVDSVDARPSGSRFVQPVLLFLLILVMLLLVARLFRLRSGERKISRLSLEERARMVSEINRWANAGKS